MKTRSLFSMLAVAAALLPSALVFAQPKQAEPDLSEQSIKKAVLDTNAKMTQAANRMDIEGMFSHILDSDKGAIIQNGVLFKSRLEAMQAVKQGLIGVTRIDRQFTNPQVTVISPDAALLASEGSVSATLTDGRTINSSFAVSLVFVRKDGQWKLLHGHYSMPARQ